MLDLQWAGGIDNYLPWNYERLVMGATDMIYNGFKNYSQLIIDLQRNGLTINLKWNYIYNGLTKDLHWIYN